MKKTELGDNLPLCPIGLFRNKASLQRTTRNQEIHVKQIRKLLEIAGKWTEIVR
jgi:hypothetical protein